MSRNLPRVLGHRGASGHEYENSLAAFRASRRLGSDGVELDVHASADGAFIVHHDAEIARLGAIAKITLPEIRTIRLPNGEAIPTLAEALAVLAGSEVWIEVKALPETLDDALLSILDTSPSPALCAVHSFDHRIVVRLGCKRTSLRRGILSASYPLDPVGPMEAAGATALWQVWDLIDAELIEAIHRRGGEVIAWTVNSTDIAGHLAALGVDALCGNYPERLRLH